MEKNTKSVIIFGAGRYGLLALKKYASRQISYIVDNNPQKKGDFLCGIEIIDVCRLKEIYSKDKYDIIIAVKSGQEIASQLVGLGINDYIMFSDDNRAYYPTNELVVNDYVDKGYLLDYSEARTSQLINQIAYEIEKYDCVENELNHIEIETINRCNGGCSFCPVSGKNDTRQFAKMSTGLFYKIIGELAELDYSGKLALFSNNEPFLDDRIIEFHKYARKKLPKARMHLFTNGTLLTIDKFKEIIPYLDELVIDNYNQSLEMIPNSKNVVKYCEQHPDLKSKVTVVLRKVDEVLSTRGGDAPNARDVSYPQAKCVLPFKQMIIRPDGKVSLCCNDPLGKITLADLNKETIMEAWNNSNYKEVRERLKKGRAYLNHCSKCDAFNLG